MFGRTCGIQEKSLLRSHWYLFPYKGNAQGIQAAKADIPSLLVYQVVRNGVN